MTLSDADLAETRRLAEAARDAAHVFDPAKAPCPRCLAIHRLGVWSTPDRVLALLDLLADYRARYERAGADLHGCQDGAALRDERARRQDVEQHERDLLARIHRDGGHLTAQRGIEASRDEAHRVIAAWIAEHDELPRLRAQLTAAKAAAWGEAGAWANAAEAFNEDSK